MGVLHTYFSAPSDEAAAATADEGPAAAGFPELDAVDPTVQAGTLLSLLTGESYDTITDDRAWARLVSDPAHDSAWVMSMPETFTVALADADDARLAAAVGPWSQTEEFWGAGDPEHLLPILTEWRALAQTTRERGENLYCWSAL